MGKNGTKEMAVNLAAGQWRFEDEAIELASVMETRATSAKTKMMTTTSGSLRTTRIVATRLPNLTSFFSVDSTRQSQAAVNCGGQLSSVEDIFPILVHSG